MAKNWLFKHGAKAPVKPVDFKWPAYYHGDDGVWGVHLSSDADTPELSNYPLNSCVISLAPMTEVSKLIKSTNYVKELLVMGGAFKHPGNETQYAETNIYLDPYSAGEVFSNDSIKIKLVPLDVTMKVYWTKEDVTKAIADAPEKKWIKDMLLTWFDKYGDKKGANFELHDPFAVLLNFNPELVKWENCKVGVKLAGEKVGATYMTNGNNCSVAVELLKYPTEIAQLIFDIIFGDKCENDK